MEYPSGGAIASSAMSASEAAQRKEEEQSKNHPINVNGHSLTLGDLYASHYDRKEMMSKLNLMDKASGGQSQGSGEPDTDPKEDVEDQLFGTGKLGGKDTAGKTAKSAPETDGEPDMEPMGKK